MSNSTTLDHLLMHLKVSRTLQKEYRALLQSTTDAIATIEQEIEAEMAETGEPSESTQDLWELKMQQAMTRYDLQLTEHDIACYDQEIRRLDSAAH